MRAAVDKVECKRVYDEDATRERGEECRGVFAAATIRVSLDSIPDGSVQLVTVESGGIWGVEEASDESYFKQLEDEQRAELDEVLSAFGIRAERGDHVPFGQEPISDAEAMDRLAAKLNEPGQWNGGDVCEVAAMLCVRTNRPIEDEPDDEDGDEFGEVELTPFRRDPDTNEAPVGVMRLDRFEDGALVEDAEGRLFNVVRQGPTQGSTEIVDDDEIHAYYDCGTLVRRHGPKKES